DHHLVVLDRLGDVFDPLADRQLGRIGDARQGGPAGGELVLGERAEASAWLAPLPTTVVPATVVATAVGAGATTVTVTVGPVGVAARARAVALLVSAHVSLGWDWLVSAIVPGMRQANRFAAVARTGRFGRSMALPGSDPQLY